jgi:hypothetical protein
MNPTTPAEWISSGYQARCDHRLDDARDCFSQALNLSGTSGDRPQTAQAHAGLGQIERDRKNIGAALYNQINMIRFQPPASRTAKR